MHRPCDLRPVLGAALLVAASLVHSTPARAAAPGDVTKDGLYDVRDLLLFESYLRGDATLDQEQLDAADVAPLALMGTTAGDGAWDVADLTVLHRLVAGEDVDQDLLSTAFEVANGLSPLVRDEDANGVSDGLDDPDQDGLTNRREETLAQNPFAADTDSDGVLDGRDAPAPVLEKTLLTNLHGATGYLYTGIDPIQANLAATIDPTRVSILRGTVRDALGTAVPGVAVSVFGRPDYGTTRTLADGQFDLVVNGGEQLTLAFAADGYLTLWRRVEAPVLDYAMLADVALQVMDPATSGAIALSEMSTTASAWLGNVVTDARGTRRPLLIFQPGTTAEAVTGGVPEALDEITVRATETTANRTATDVPSLPLELPGGVDPVWVGDFAVEEALDADEVRFHNNDTAFQTDPVVLYFENFVDYATGTPVGNANLNTGLAAWLETGNTAGVVVKILGREDLGGGTFAALVDLTGDDVADPLGEEERKVLAAYADGQTLWRVPLTHFSKFCTHKGVAWPADTTNPDTPDPTPQAPDDCAPTCGSRIDTESQVLREQIPVAGTPWSLHYTSERTPGYLAAYRVNIPLTGPTIPNSLAAVRVQVEIAGKRETSPLFERDLPPEDVYHLGPNLSYSFVWGGLDAYERLPQGRQPVRARLEWWYPFKQTLDANGFPEPGALLRGGGARVREWEGFLGPWDNRAQGLGGWTLTPVHAYDSRTSILYRGDGERISAERLPAVIMTANTNALTNRPDSVAAAPDGSVYVALPQAAPFSVDFSQVGRIEPDGMYVRIAGKACVAGANPNLGGPADEACLKNPTGVAVGPDGSLYISDQQLHQILKVAAPVSPDSTISLVAGNGTAAFAGDGGQASEASLSFPRDIALAPDGSLFIADGGNFVVRAVSPDGVIRTVAGNRATAICEQVGQLGFPLSALGVPLSTPLDVAAAPDGSLYVSSDCGFVFQISSDGQLTRLAGRTAADPPEGPNGGDGGSATQAELYVPSGIEVAPDGGLYIATGQSTSAGAHRVRYVGTDGLITTVAGDGMAADSPDGGPAAGAQLNYPVDVSLDPLGRLFIAELNNGQVNTRHVRRIEPPLPGFQVGDIFVPSADGREIYRFDSTGRHFETRDAVRGTTLLEMAYDDDHGLLSIDDQQGNMTTVQRNPMGVPTAIEGPFGDTTTLDVDAQGWLTLATDPAGGDYDPDYDPGTTSEGTGLLTSWTTPEEHPYVYHYDEEGLLDRDDDPAGGFKTLVRTEAPPQDPPGWSVAVTTALGQESTYDVARSTDGTEMRTVTDPASLTTTRVRTPDFVDTVTDPREVVTVTEPAADPRLGFVATFDGSLDLTTGGGRHLVRSQTRTVEESGGVVTSQTDTITVNTRPTTVLWQDAAMVPWNGNSQGLRTTTSPEGRILEEALDARSRLVGTRLGSLHPVRVTYDTRGRIESLTHGPGDGTDRVTQFAYDPMSGRLASITDPLQRVTTFDVYDGAGRVEQMTLPGDRVVGFGYDSNGNLTSLTPPGQPDHLFHYTPIDLEDEYTPPALSGISDPRTTYTYDIDRRLDYVTRPDGKTVDPVYETAPNTGRLDSVTIAEGTYNYDYYAAGSGEQAGQLASITAPDGGGTLSYGWDGPLPVSETWSGTLMGSVTRTFDNDLRVETEGVGGAETATFHYDDDSLLDLVTPSTGAPLTLVRNPTAGFGAGLLTGTTQGVVTTTETPSAFGELESLTATESAGPSTLYALDVSDRDKLGRIETKVVTIGASTTTNVYTYDDAGRLDTVTVNGNPVADYGYDDNGNRTHLNGQQVGIYDDQDRLTSYAGTAYTYTDAGDLESKTDGSGTTNYGYDALGNLRTVTFPSGMRIEYVIDGQNRRIGKKVCAAPCGQGATATLQQGFLYADQLRIVAELDSSNQVVSRFVYATRPNVPDFMVKGGTTYRILSDQVGSVRLVVNATTGATAQRIDYDAFGVITQDTNPGFQPFGFAGGLTDRDTGLVRFGARDFDPTVGRWTAKDPIRFDGGGANLFAYVLGDPVGSVDVDGLEPLFGYGEALRFYGRTSLQGWAAFADGVFLFGDPLAGCVYDPSDPTLDGSRASGELVREINLALGGATWLARSSWFYNSSVFGRSSWLFARGRGALNSIRYLRLGWGWRAPTSQNVFRLAVGQPLRSGPSWTRRAWQWARHMDFF